MQRPWQDFMVKPQNSIEMSRALYDDSRSLFLVRPQHVRDRGFGVYAVVLKTSGELVRKIESLGFTF